jgi:hypothetical protein
MATNRMATWPRPSARLPFTAPRVGYFLRTIERQTRGSTAEGQFYLQDGKLRYRSSRTTGAASLSEDKGKTTLTVTPEDPNYQTGKAEYERVR